MRIPSSFVFMTIAVLALSACSTHTPAISRLDSSGLTVVTLRNPIVLARPVRQIAVAARDYAYVGPVELNRMGMRDYYLWVGLATTVDRALADVTPASADALALIVDGEPMTLSLAQWNTSLDEPPYRPPLPLYASLAARASLDQIQRIASARSIEVHLISDTGRTARYQRWTGAWPSWSALGRNRDTLNQNSTRVNKN